MRKLGISCFITLTYLLSSMPLYANYDLMSQSSYKQAGAAAYSRGVRTDVRKSALGAASAGTASSTTYSPVTAVGGQRGASAGGYQLRSYGSSAGSSQGGGVRYNGGSYSSVGSYSAAAGVVTGSLQFASGSKGGSSSSYAKSATKQSGSSVQRRRVNSLEDWYEQWWDEYEDAGHTGLDDLYDWWENDSGYGGGALYPDPDVENGVYQGFYNWAYRKFPMGDAVWFMLLLTMGYAMINIRKRLMVKG